MKNHVVIFLLTLLLFVSSKMFAQPQPTFTFIPETITTNGLFDTVYNQYGQVFRLADLNLLSSRPFGGSNTISTVPTVSCTAGKFTIFFAPTSTVFCLGSQTLAAQNIVCEVYSNLSGFINSNIAPGSINIYCDDVLTGGGSGEVFFLFPPNQTNPGVTDGVIYQALTSGIDPYSTIPMVAFQNTGGSFANHFYHGRILMNPNPGTPWNYNMSAGTISSNEVDFFQIILHEAMHTLGFLSLIAQDGYSVFGASKNWFSRYDQFLRDANNQPLLTSTVTACPGNGLTFNPSLNSYTAICQSVCVNNPPTNATTTCSLAATYAGGTFTSAVYTPFCFQPGSSLSHFEDMCTLNAGFVPACTPTPALPGYNNMSWVMSNWTDDGNCFLKRYFKEEEKQVLCDLGYSFTGLTYASNAAGATHTYSYGCAPTATVVGVNDGFSGGVYTYTTTSASATLNIPALLANDTPTLGLAMSCVEVVYGNATITGGTPNFTVNATVGAGLVVLKYRPQNSLGYGNATYIFVYFIPSGCNPAGTFCNLIQNPGFENMAAGTLLQCGGLSANQAVLGCWTPYFGTPFLYASNCGGWQLGVNTLGISPPVSSFNGVGNTRAITVGSGGFSINGLGNAMINNLSSPLIPGTTYRFSGWFQNVVGTPTSGINPNSAPMVISICSAIAPAPTPTLSFPAGLNPLIEFTINPGNNWSYVTNTFVYSSTLAPAPVIVIGSHSVNATAITNFSINLHCFMDELNIEAIPSPTFALPQTTICAGTSYSNLAQYASAGITFSTFSGSGVTNTSGVYAFNSPPTLTAGSYPIAFSYTYNGCENTIWQNVVVSDNFTFTASSSGTYCANTGGGYSLTAGQTSTTTGVTYNWQPGALTGTPQVVSPTVTTVYTVTGNSGGCTQSQTLAVTVFNTCCGTTTYNPPGSFGNNLNGPVFVNSDLSLTGGVYNFSGEIIMGNNIKIDIAPGATLNVAGAHIYACGTQMWKGITVGNNAGLSMSASGASHNLIEDAIAAVDVSSQTTCPVPGILNLTNTTFNKNFVDVNISNYLCSSSSFSNSFIIHSCVFSCRNFTFTGSSWPSTSTSDLRSAASSTSGLDVPYLLQSASVVLLKPPYASQSSSIAIHVSTLGVNSSSVYYQGVLGSPTATNFNLFDNHHTFIHTTDANLRVVNNVFQNTKYVSGQQGSGDAIYDIVEDPTFHNILDLSGTSFSTGNRFWNCHRGVEGKNIYNFRIEKGQFRSTQVANGFDNGFSAGNTGIVLNTNGFRYWLLDNDFANINTCINIPFTPSPSDFFPSYIGGGYTSGIYAGNITIQGNAFYGGLLTSISGSLATVLPTYINKAIEITNFTQGMYFAPAPSLTPAVMGVHIDNNTITEAYRGIGVTGMTGLPADILNNDISLIEDTKYGMAQYGIGLYNSFANTNTYGKHVITDNTVKSVGSNTLTNNLTSLIHCGGNMGPGLQSPSVTCNDVRESFNGFEFAGPNQGMMWRANQMEDLARGMLLNNSGVIGEQGSSSLGIANGWNGTWGGASNNGIYTNLSTASLSVLWVTPANVPPNLDGNPTPECYAIMGLSITSGYSGYSCIAPTAFVSNPNPPSVSQYTNSDHYYIAKIAMYNFFIMNDSILTSNSDYTDFYDQNSGTNIGSFAQIDAALADNDIASASIIKGTITSGNSIDYNYLTYYELYINYETNNFEPTTADDSTALINLSSLCPDDNGACVYQARSLYNTVFKKSPFYPICESVGARLAYTWKKEINSKKWQLSLYPNPATDKITISSSTENEILFLKICDLSGRILLNDNIKIKGFIANLDLTLINGAYLVTITNSKNETLNTKLLISR